MCSAQLVFDKIIQIDFFGQFVDISQLSQIDFSRWKIHGVDLPRDLHQGCKRDGFLNEFPGILHEIQYLANISIEQLIPEQIQLNIVLVP